MPANDPAQYEMEEDFLPWPSDTNDKPFMTYDKLMSGAMGKPAPKQGKFEFLQAFGVKLHQICR